MNIIRNLARLALWGLSAIGVISVLLLAANMLGVIQPLMVVSGSMAPVISTGDLVIGRSKPVEDLQVGQIATLMSPQTGKYVTHRVTGITTADSMVNITMKGDANEDEDPFFYEETAGSTAWIPLAVIPGGGYFTAKILRPAVLIPGLLGVLALIALTLPSDNEDKGTKNKGEYKDGAHKKEAAAA